jgi:dUTP pyrophosphatase
MSIKIVKRNENAVIPSRAHETDIGLDLTAIKVHKNINENTIMYDTGIAAAAPPGYYLEIIPRSSISKSGWMLANSIGVIDPDYSGNLYIVLTRVVHTAKDLVPPFCNCQLVLRKAEYAPVVEVTDLSDELPWELMNLESRGDGGFGSTGSRV